MNSSAVPPLYGEFLDDLAHERLLAIIRSSDPAAAARAALVLLESGIRFLGVSLVSKDALRVIAEVVRRAPPGCVIGAGTVLTRKDVSRAQEAGARFMVTPAVTEGVTESVARGIPVLAACGGDLDALRQRAAEFLAVAEVSRPPR